MWVKLDDRMPGHPKILACDLSARWLYIKGLCHAGLFLTDGFLRDSDVAELVKGLPRPAKAVQQLTSAGLWTKEGEGFRIHDFLNYNPARATVEAERDKGRKRIAEWRQKASRNAERTPLQVEDSLRSNAVRTSTPSSSSSSSSVIKSSKSLDIEPAPEAERNAEGLTFAEFAASQGLPAMLKKLDEKSRPPY